MSISMNDLNTFCPSNREEWRNWLAAHHLSTPSVWLILYKKKSNIPSITWSEAVDEALCFGWIDSTKKTIDEHSYMQYFGQRKPKSTWSKVNKEKIKKLEEKGLITAAGREIIEIAKKNGSWNILDEVESLQMPDDLQKELDLYPNANSHYSNFSKSTKKSLMYWITSAKRAATREKRIKEVAELTNQNLKPKQFR